MDQHDPSSSFSDPLTPPSFQPSTERAPVTFYDNVPLVGPGLNPQFYNPTGPRSRTRTTDSQLKVLLEVYAQDRRPTNARKREIADQIGMTVKQVQVWFQNRRATAKVNEKKHREREGASLSGIARHSVSKGPPKFARPVRPLDPSPEPEENRIILHPAPVPENGAYTSEPAPPSLLTTSSLVSSIPETFDDISRVSSSPVNSEQEWQDMGDVDPTSSSSPQFSGSASVSRSSSYSLDVPIIHTPTAMMTEESEACIGTLAVSSLHQPSLSSSTTQVPSLLVPVGQTLFPLSQDSSPTTYKTPFLPPPSESLSPNTTSSRYQQDAMFGRHQSLPGVSPSRQRSAPYPSPHTSLIVGSTGGTSWTPTLVSPIPTTTGLPSRLEARRKSTMGFVVPMRKSFSAGAVAADSLLLPDGNGFGRHRSGSFSGHGNRGRRGSAPMPIAMPLGGFLPSVVPERRRKRGMDREGGGASSPGGGEVGRTEEGPSSLVEMNKVLGSKSGYMPHPLATKSSRESYIRAHKESQHVMSTGPFTLSPSFISRGPSSSHQVPWRSRSLNPISISPPKPSYSHRRSSPISNPSLCYPSELTECFPPVRPVVSPPPGPLPSLGYTLGTSSSSGSPNSGSGSDKDKTPTEDDEKRKERKETDTQLLIEGEEEASGEHVGESSSVMLQVQDGGPPSSPRSLLPFTIPHSQEYRNVSQDSSYSSYASSVAHFRHASTASQESALRFGSTPSIGSIGSLATSISTGAFMMQNTEENRVCEDVVLAMDDDDDNGGGRHYQQEEEVLSAPHYIESMPMLPPPSFSPRTEVMRSSSSSSSFLGHPHGAGCQQWSSPPGFAPDMRRASCPATFLHCPILESANETVEEGVTIESVPVSIETSPSESSPGGGVTMTSSSSSSSSSSVFVEPRLEDAPSMTRVHSHHVPPPTTTQTELVASPQTEGVYHYEDGSPETSTSVGSSPSVYLTPQGHSESPGTTTYTVDTTPVSTSWTHHHPSYSSPQHTSYGPSGYAGYGYDPTSTSGQTLSYPREMSISSHYTPRDSGERQEDGYGTLGHEQMSTSSITLPPLPAFHSSGQQHSVSSSSYLEGTDMGEKGVQESYDPPPCVALVGSSTHWVSSSHPTPPSPAVIHGPGPSSSTIYSSSQASSPTTSPLYDPYGGTSPGASTTMYSQDTPASTSTWVYTPSSIVSQGSTPGTFLGSMNECSPSNYADTPDSVLSDYHPYMMQQRQQPRYEPPASYQLQYNAPKTPARSSLAGALGDMGRSARPPLSPQPPPSPN